jgi:prepilin-type N-terminal cleavage/methylation domain-containing protein
MRSTTTDNAITERLEFRQRLRSGFTLIEVLTALGILAFVTSSVLLVVDRSIVSASDSTLQMEAFQLARENMEKVLAGESVEETVEYGRSDMYSDITWQTVVEAFDEPIGGTTWIRAVCSAEYKDSAGQQQKVELEHWITDLTDQQANQLAGQPQSIEDLTAEQVIATAEQAAEYAGVDTDTLDQWVENGLVTMPGGAFIKHNLDVYIHSSGKPTDAEKQQQVESIEELAKSLPSQQQGEQSTPDGLQSPDGRNPLTGMPQEQSDEMRAREAMRMLHERRQK